MKKLLTLLLFLAPAILARAEEVTLCLHDLSGGVMSEFPFSLQDTESYTTNTEGCATVDLSPGENQIQYDGGFTDFEWDGSQTRVDVTIDNGYWMTVQFTGIDESEKNAFAGAVFNVITDQSAEISLIDESLTVHLWFSAEDMQGNTWSYMIHSPKYPTPCTSVDLAATGNHLTVDLREGRTPVNVIRPIGVDGTPLTGSSINIYQEDGRGEPLSADIPLDEIPEGGAYRSWIVPGTYYFSFEPEENYLSRRMPVTIGAEPATVAFDLNQSVRLNVHLIGYDGKPIANRHVNIYSIDRTAGGNYVSTGYGTTNDEGIATVYAKPGSYGANALFYDAPLFPYPMDPCGETHFDVPAGETAEATISFENYTALIATIKDQDKYDISVSCRFEDKEGNRNINLYVDRNFEGDGYRFGTLVRADGPMSGRIVVDIDDMSESEDAPLYVNYYSPMTTIEGAVVAEIDLSAMQEVTLRAPEGYCFYSGLFIDGEEYAFGHSDTGDPITVIPARIMPGKHTWQATLTSLDGSTRYPTGTVQTFTVGDAPMNVTYALDTADYPGLRPTVKGMDGTPATDFYAAMENVGTARR